MRRATPLVLAAILATGCTPDGPLGAVGAIVTAPITAPVMFVSARMNDREDHLERARRNDRAPCLPSTRNRERWLERPSSKPSSGGTTDAGLYWQNDRDASGYAAGGVTVLATGQTDDGRPCREVLIETAMEGRPTDQRVRTYCRHGASWSVAVRTRE